MILFCDVQLYINLMTNNYQFDKNSNLFKKFLAAKNNKNNESMVEQHPSRRQEEDFAKKNRSFIEKPSSHIDQKDRSTSNQTFNAVQRGPLHVTVDDLEEAASAALNESSVYQSQIAQIEDNKFNIEEERNRSQQNMKKEAVSNEIQEVVEKHTLRVLPKQDRKKQRRTRDFHQRPKRKEQLQEQHQPSRATQNICHQRKIEVFEGSFNPKNAKLNFEIENIEPNFVEEEPPKKLEEAVFTLGSNEAQYRKKYEKLVIKYEQMKDTLQEQRKQKQFEVNEKDSDYENLKEKYYDLRSTEDTLATDLKRYKDKLQNENILRTRLQEEVKELNFRVMQLEQILEGRQVNLRKKNDEVNHWKSQNEQLRGQLKQSIAEIESLEEKCNFMESEYKIMQRDVSNKQGLVEELRKNVGTLIEENTIAKDQIYKLTIRLYQLQQQNMSLKGDIMRRQKQLPHQLSMIQESYAKKVENLSPKRSLQRLERYRQPQREDVPVREPNQGRKRQFARERGTTKVEKIERPNERGERRQIRNQNDRIQTVPDSNSHKIAARIAYLQEELEARSKQKAVNGQLRRQKMQLQRELQSLLQKQS